MSFGRYHGFRPGSILAPGNVAGTYAFARAIAGLAGGASGLKRRRSRYKSGLRRGGGFKRRRLSGGRRVSSMSKMRSRLRRRRSGRRSRSVIRHFKPFSSLPPKMRISVTNFVYYPWTLSGVTGFPCYQIMFSYAQPVAPFGIAASGGFINIGNVNSPDAINDPGSFLMDLTNGTRTFNNYHFGIFPNVFGAYLNYQVRGVKVSIRLDPEHSAADTADYFMYLGAVNAENAAAAGTVAISGSTPLTDIKLLPGFRVATQHAAVVAGSNTLAPLALSKYFPCKPMRPRDYYADPDQFAGKITANFGTYSAPAQGVGYLAAGIMTKDGATFSATGVKVGTLYIRQKLYLDVWGKRNQDQA